MRDGHDSCVPTTANRRSVVGLERCPKCVTRTLQVPLQALALVLRGLQRCGDVHRPARWVTRAGLWLTCRSRGHTRRQQRVWGRGGLLWHKRAQMARFRGCSGVGGSGTILA